MENQKPKKLYTLSEELINAISHGAGTIFGVLVTILCTKKCIDNQNVTALICSAVFGCSLIILYSMSTLYHSLASGRAKNVFRVLDHCSIFVLIAGTYTPYTLVALGGLALGKVIFAIVWLTAILGVTFNAIDLKKYSIFSNVCYVVVGWIIMIGVVPLFAKIGAVGFWLLLSGGVAYTIGAVLYGVGKRKKYFHSIFHFLCLVGSVLQFLSIYFFVI